MTDSESVDGLLKALPNRSVLVLGDFFLDDYAWLDSELTEVSLETGLDAYQIVRRQRQPGAAGTVVNNLVALGVGSIQAVGLIGDDGEGFELRRGLEKLGVELSGLISSETRMTPTYLKPMLEQIAGARELNRLDARNRDPMLKSDEDRLLTLLREKTPLVEAVIVADQAPERNCGAVTDRLRDELSRLAEEWPKIVFLADSRVRIGEYSGVLTKPNERELAGLFSVDPPVVESGEVSMQELSAMGQELSRRTGKPVIVTAGKRGSLVCSVLEVTLVPAVPVEGTIDVVGAGDSATAGIVSSLLVGSSLVDAVRIGNRVASVTIQKLGTTGTCSPEELQARSCVALQAGAVDPGWDRRPTLPGGLEIFRKTARGPIRAALFDFDGTLSLVRQGWQDVMAPFMVEELQRLGSGEPAEELERIVREFMFRLTGKETLYQMVQLAREVELRGGVPLDPAAYKAEYHARLWERIRERVERLRSGDARPEAYLIPGSIRLLERLREEGVQLFLASGTDIEYVRDEAEALGLTTYFGPHIYGALRSTADFSKKMVIERILAENQLSGPDLVAVGDGYVEIEDTRRAGGRAVGAATFEAEPGRLDPWKRNRLVAAGADVIVADFSHADFLVDWLQGVNSHE